MGRIINLAEFRAKRDKNRLDGVYMESLPPYIVLKFYEEGDLVGEHKIPSERMIREFLDSLP